MSVLVKYKIWHKLQNMRKSQGCGKAGIHFQESNVHTLSIIDSSGI